MEITYIQVLGGVCILLFGTLAGFQLMKFIGKKEFNEEQTKIVLLIQDYAKKCYEDLKTEFNGEDELKAKIVQLVATEFPQVNQKLITIAINFILDQAENLLSVSDGQTS